MDAWKRKLRNARYVLLGQFFFLGVEYSVVLPSMPFYLKEVNTPDLPVFFGCIYAAYMLSSMICALVLGRLEDSTLQFRRIVLVTNVVTLLGNAMYVIGRSPYMILTGRFLAGAADAMFPMTYGEYGRCYSNEEMRRQVSYLMAAYSMGFCIGPGFNLLPKSKEIDLGFVSIRYTNAPGVLLFFGYLLLIVLTLFGLSDLTREKQLLLSDLGNEATFLIRKEEIVLDNVSRTSNGNEIEHCEDSDSRNCASTSRKVLAGQLQPWWKVLFAFLTRTDILILLYGQIVWSYSLSSGSGFLPLFATQSLKMPLNWISYLYMASGVIMAFILWGNTRFLSRYSSVSMSISGFASVFSSFWFLILSDMAHKVTSWGSIITFFIFAVHFYTGFYLNSIALKAIVSYRVAPENQSFCQGVFSATEYITAIVAGVGIGVSFRVLTYSCYWTMLLNLLACVIFAMSFERLCKPIVSVDEFADNKELIPE